MALLEAKGFSADDFRNFHPGGRLGAQIKHARDIMHGKDELPLVRAGTAVIEAIAILTDKRFGCVGVIDDSQVLIGIVTDGDLRRNLQTDLSVRKIEAIMSPNPTTVSGHMLAAEVIELINAKRITAVFVVDKDASSGRRDPHS